MKNIILILVILILSACVSNHKQRPPSQENFVTHIENNGTKLFNFTLTINNPKGNKEGKTHRSKGGAGFGSVGGSNQGRMGRGRKNGSRKKPENTKDQIIHMKQRIKDKMRLALFNTQYCREGYIEIDSIYIPGNSSIKGQCQESASKDDLSKFPNQ